MNSQNIFLMRGASKNEACGVDGQGRGFIRFRKITFFILTVLLIVFAAFTPQQGTQVDGYFSVSQRTLSPENSTYYIDPVNGDDSNNGTDKNTPWQSFDKINSLILTKGNIVKILSSGELRNSLFLMAEGSEEAPVKVEFAHGTYDFFPERSVKRKFYISNTNDSPDSLKSVAFYILKSKNVVINGNGAEIIFRGKVMETVIDSSENVTVENISFDYKRPTVSEMKIISVNNDYAVAEIHKDSWYEISKGGLIWIGEGWKHKVQKLWQVYEPETGDLYRKNLPVGRMRFSNLSSGRVRIDFERNPGFKKGFVYQNRNTFRDYAAVFVRNSKNIAWNNVNVYFMHGMGFVSQFTENITFNDVCVAPREDSGRTCAAWADILHFSGCKGKININKCFLSAANDDAVNVHGTHLRIIEILPDAGIKVRFMHNQTYGFDAFFPGDKIEFINSKTLIPYAENEVTEVKRLDDKTIELKLRKAVPADIGSKDVIENTAWTPDVSLRNSTITHIPTRGVLITTQGKVVIENNDFLRPHMSAILIADDANNWYESGYVSNVSIRNNRFLGCGSPVINIHPENSVVKKGEYIHSNIKIENNFFKLLRIPALSAKSSENISFTRNKIEVTEKRKISDLVKLKACSNVKIEGNRIKVVER